MFSQVPELNKDSDPKLPTTVLPIHGILNGRNELYKDCEKLKTSKEEDVANRKTVTHCFCGYGQLRGRGDRGVARGKQSTFGRRLRGARLSAPVMNEALISLKGANEVLRGGTKRERGPSQLTVGAWRQRKGFKSGGKVMSGKISI